MNLKEGNLQVNQNTIGMNTIHFVFRVGRNASDSRNLSTPPSFFQNAEIKVTPLQEAAGMGNCFCFSKQEFEIS